MIVCLGAFDGYHRGHFSLFEKARALAEKRREEWKIVTFSPHPRFVLGGLKARLFTPDEKALLRACFDLPEPVRIPFTKEFAATEPSSFLDELRARLGVTGIVVGREFRFGRARSGDGAFLTEYCRKNGLELALMPQLLSPDGAVICSTRARDMVQAGSVEQAAELLGYPYFIVSEVVHGEHRGSALGYPTANMRPDEKKLIPGEGVYAGAMRHAGRWYPAAVSVGRNPTFLVEGSLRVEAHVIGYSGELYGARPMLALLRRLRPMARYSGGEALTRQLAVDCASTREIFAAAAKQLEIFKKLPE